jgi:polyisoprenoid-binding protein YceI
MKGPTLLRSGDGPVVGWGVTSFRAPLLVLTLLTAYGAALAEPFEALLLPESTVEYEIRDSTSVIVGVAPLATLELSFDDDDLSGARLRTTLVPERFSTGNILRDTNARRTVFEIRDFPEIAFEAVAVAADPGDLPDGVTRSLLLRGRLELHGVVREIEVPVEVRREGQRLSVIGAFSVLLSDHAMLRPGFLFLTIEDRVEVRLQIEAELIPGGG